MKHFLLLSFTFLGSIPFAQTSINEFLPLYTENSMTTEAETTSAPVDVLAILQEVIDEQQTISEITTDIAVLLAHQIEDEDYFAEVLEEVEQLATETTETTLTECEELITDDLRAELCGNIRTQQDSIRRPTLGYAEHKLLELAGVDIDNDDPDLTEEKMAIFWKKNYKCLECRDVVPPFPRGNYLKQLASESFLRSFRTFLRAYRFPPNIIDETDGCTVLDYVDAQIRRTPASSTLTHKYLQDVRKLLIREGAKHANDLGGKC